MATKIFDINFSSKSNNRLDKVEEITSSVSSLPSQFEKLQQEFNKLKDNDWETVTNHNLDIQNINNTLNNKADKSQIIDFVNKQELQTSLEKKQDKGDYALNSDIKNINNTLNNKADKSDIPDISSFITLEQLQEKLNDYMLTSSFQNIINNYYQKQEINTMIAKGSYLKPVAIIGQGTRNVYVTGGLQTNVKYWIEFTWANNKDGNRTFLSYTHQGQSNNTDIQRFIVSSVAGLLPNVIALSNNFANGFKISAVIGTENTSGFIFNVYQETNLNS